ncbi:MAG: flagellar hook-length control protein FliK, partial [Pararhodobacter sp.]
ASEPAAERLIRVAPPGPAMPEALRSDPVDPGSAAARVTGTVASPQQGEPARPEAVAPVLRQISGALVSTRAGMTEIMLAPEELGRLHMIWTGHDRPQLVLWAERPETLDLLRRNIDLLTAELQEAGVDAGLLDFRDGPPPELPGQARRDMPPEPEEAAQAQRIAVAASTSLAAGATRLASTRRIDVRL